MRKNDEKISASEINRYVYCPYQWYYERYYGKKYLRDKYNDRNEALGYTGGVGGNFKRGLEFHEKYMPRYKARRLIKMIISLIIFAAMILLAVLASKNAAVRRSKPSLSILGYKLYYTDQKGTKRKEGIIYSKLLLSDKYGLHGKPDFIFKRKDTMIPVELKSGKGGKGPKKGDMLQLCAYMLIIEDVFLVKAPEGRLIYNDVMFIIKNTRNLRRELFETVEQMRQMLKTGVPTFKPNDPSFAHCKYCVCRDTVCERV